MDVWIWLPQRSEPILMGHLAPSTDGQILCFRYDLSYLHHPDAYSVSPAEIPLRSGWQEPKVGLYVAGCFSDATPDAWGRRVIEARQMALSNTTFPLSEQDYLLLSNSDRWGCFRFSRVGPRVCSPSRNSCLRLHLTWNCKTSSLTNNESLYSTEPL